VAIARAKTLRQSPLSIYDLPEEVKAAVRRVQLLDNKPSPIEPSDSVYAGTDDDDGWNDA
jgi:hypothetical protein